MIKMGLSPQGLHLLFSVFLQVPLFSAGSTENNKRINSVPAFFVYPVAPEDGTGASLREAF